MQITLGIVGNPQEFPVTVIPEYKYIVDGGEPVSVTTSPFTLAVDLLAGEHTVSVELFDSATGQSLAPIASSTFVLDKDTQTLLVPTGVEIVA